MYYLCEAELYLAQPSTLNPQPSTPIKKAAVRQPLFYEKKNKSRFFSGFYIAPKKTAPPFLI